jgi:hypothetical protein
MLVGLPRSPNLEEFFHCTVFVSFGFHPDFSLTSILDEQTLSHLLSFDLFLELFLLLASFYSDLVYSFHIRSKFFSCFQMSQRSMMGFLAEGIQIVLREDSFDLLTDSVIQEMKIGFQRVGKSIGI